MASNSTTACTLCQEDDLSTSAICWCSDCETFLCTNCSKHHSKIKSSKHHVIISVEEYNSLPPFILDTSNRCRDHDLLYESYCKFHESVCCMKCTRDKHKYCRDVEPVSEVFGDIKSSSVILSTEQRLETIHDDLEDISLYLSTRLSSLQSQRAKCLNEVSVFRESFLQRLDDLQQQFLDEIDKRYNHAKSKTDILLSEVNEKKKHVNILQTDYVKMIQYATNLQTHLGLRVVQQCIEDDTSFLQNLQSEQKISEISLEFEISPEMQSFLLKGINTLGRVSSVTKESKFELKSNISDNIQQVPTALYKREPKLVHTYILPKYKPTVTGCQLLPDNRVIIACHSHRCVILFDKCKVSKRHVVSFKDHPYDICYVKDEVAAITFPGTGEVKFFDIHRRSIINVVVVGKCFGIDSDGTILVVGLKDGLVIMKHDGKEIGRIPGQQFNYITLFNENIYSSDSLASSISCQTKDGHLLWKCKHKNLTDPGGIAIDKDGLIYVTCNDSKSVVAFSSDDLQCWVILNKANGIKFPYSLSIDRNTSKLLVGQWLHKKIFMLQI